MHVVRLQTKDELLELLEWIFFRKDGEFHEFAEARLSFEETQSILGLRDHDFAPGVEIDTDEWYDIIENLDEEALKKVVLSNDCPLVRDFTPGTLVWKLEDDYDRVGDFNIRVFTFTPDAEATADAHRQWREEGQKHYDHSCEVESRIRMAFSQLQQ